MTDEIKRVIRHEKREIVRAVDSIDLKVKQGELFGILGPNGAGKTTLIKLFTCMLYPNEGTAIINGFDVKEEREMAKASSSLICGWWGTFFNRTLRQNIEFWGRMFGLAKEEAKQRADEAVKILDLEKYQNDLPWHLSAGTRRKMGLAKALILRTPIVFLDEPTIALDPNVAYSVRDFIKTTLNQERGQTVFMATHYMFEADILCDKVGIMDRGKMVAVDTPSSLKQKVAEKGLIEVKLVNLTKPEETAKALTDLDGIEKATYRIEDPTLGRATMTLHLTAMDRPDALRTAVQVLESRGIQVVYTRPSKPTLEDVFAHLTGKSME